MGHTENCTFDLMKTDLHCKTIWLKVGIVQKRLVKFSHIEVLTVQVLILGHKQTDGQMCIPHYALIITLKRMLKMLQLNLLANQI
jgi:hypothetical protein